DVRAMEDITWVLERLDWGLPDTNRAYHILSLAGTSPIFEMVLSNLRDLICEIGPANTVWDQLISHRNWRYAIVGCTYVLFTKSSLHSEQLRSRFDTSPWKIAPHFAVALGLVHPEIALCDFHEVCAK